MKSDYLQRLTLICPIYLPLRDKNCKEFDLSPVRASCHARPTLPRMTETSGKSQKNPRFCWAFYEGNTLGSGIRLQRAAEFIVGGSCAAWYREVAISNDMSLITKSPASLSRVTMWLIIIANSSWGLNEQVTTFVFCNTPTCLIFVMRTRYMYIVSIIPLISRSDILIKKREARRNRLQ